MKSKEKELKETIAALNVEKAESYEENLRYREIVRTSSMDVQKLKLDKKMLEAKLDDLYKAHFELREKYLLLLKEYSSMIEKTMEQNKPFNEFKGCEDERADNQGG